MAAAPPRVRPWSDPEAGAAFVSVPILLTDDAQAIIDANPAGTTYDWEAGTRLRGGQPRYRFKSNDVHNMNGVILDGELIAGTKEAFYGYHVDPAQRIHGVTVVGVTVIRFTPDGQLGAIALSHHNIAENSTDWTLDHCSATFCKGASNGGAGLRPGTRTTVIAGAYDDNAENGITGIGDGIVLAAPPGEYLYVRRNNSAGNNQGHNAGGVKIVLCSGGVFRRVWAEDNNGKGLWWDIDCGKTAKTLTEYCVLLNNSHGGIMTELDYGAVIRFNTCRGNSANRPVGWAWDGQIILANAEEQEVYANVVDGVNGITLIEQADNPPGNARHHQDGTHAKTRNCDIIHNHVWWDTATGVSQYYGLSTDGDTTPFGAAANITFRRNHYHWNGGTTTRFTWDHAQKSYTQWQGDDHDVGAEVAETFV